MERITTYLEGTAPVAQALMRPVSICCGHSFDKYGKEYHPPLAAKVALVALSILLLPLSLPAICMGMILVARSDEHKKHYHKLFCNIEEEEADQFDRNYDEWVRTLKPTPLADKQAPLPSADQVDATAQIGVAATTSVQTIIQGNQHDVILDALKQLVIALGRKPVNPKFKSRVKDALGLLLQLDQERTPRGWKDYLGKIEMKVVALSEFAADIEKLTNYIDGKGEPPAVVVYSTLAEEKKRAIHNILKNFVEKCDDPENSPVKTYSEAERIKLDVRGLYYRLSELDEKELQFALARVQNAVMALPDAKNPIYKCFKAIDETVVTVTEDMREKIIIYLRQALLWNAQSEENQAEDTKGKKLEEILKSLYENHFTHRDLSKEIVDLKKIYDGEDVFDPAAIAVKKAYKILRLEEELPIPSDLEERIRGQLLIVKRDIGPDKLTPNPRLDKQIDLILKGLDNKEYSLVDIRTILRQLQEEHCRGGQFSPSLAHLKGAYAQVTNPSRIEAHATAQVTGAAALSSAGL